MIWGAQAPWLSILFTFYYCSTQKMLKVTETEKKVLPETVPLNADFLHISATHLSPSMFLHS